MENTTQCKTCGGTVAKSAQVCPHCGARNPQLSESAKKGLTIFAVVAILFAVIMIFVLLFGGSGGGKDTTISMAEFNKITTGMTYRQVVDIIGVEGELLSEVDIGYSEYATRIYCWEGNGATGSNANVTFQGGKVVSKAQIGLR